MVEQGMCGKCGNAYLSDNHAINCESIHLNDALAAMTAERDGLKAALADCPTHEELDAAAFEINRLKKELENQRLHCSEADLELYTTKSRAERMEKALRNILDYGEALQPSPMHPVTFNACLIAKEALDDGEGVA